MSVALKRRLLLGADQLEQPPILLASPFHGTPRGLRNVLPLLPSSSPSSLSCSCSECLMSNQSLCHYYSPELELASSFHWKPNDGPAQCLWFHLRCHLYHHHRRHANPTHLLAHSSSSQAKLAILAHNLSNRLVYISHNFNPWPNWEQVEVERIKTRRINRKMRRILHSHHHHNYHCATNRR